MVHLPPGLWRVIKMDYLDLGTNSKYYLKGVKHSLICEFEGRSAEVYRTTLYALLRAIDYTMYGTIERFRRVEATYAFIVQNLWMFNRPTFFGVKHTASLRAVILKKAQAYLADFAEGRRPGDVEFIAAAEKLQRALFLAAYSAICCQALGEDWNGGNNIMHVALKIRLSSLDICHEGLFRAVDTLTSTLPTIGGLMLIRYPISSALEIGRRSLPWRRRAATKELGTALAAFWSQAYQVSTGPAGEVALHLIPNRCLQGLGALGAPLRALTRARMACPVRLCS